MDGSNHQYILCETLRKDQAQRIGRIVSETLRYDSRYRHCGCRMCLSTAQMCVFDNTFIPFAALDVLFNGFKKKIHF